MQKANYVRKSTNSRSFSGQRVTSNGSRIDRPLFSPTGTLPVQSLANNQLTSRKATRSAPDLGFLAVTNGVGGGGAATQRSQTARKTLWMEKSAGTVGRVTNSNQVGSFQGVSRRPSSMQSNGESRNSVIRSGQAKDISGWVL